MKNLRRRLRWQFAGVNTTVLLKKNKQHMLDLSSQLGIRILQLYVAAVINQHLFA